MLDYIDACRGGGSRKGRGRGSDDVSWVSLFHSVLVYIDKETDCISKLEDKGSTSTMALSTRLMRKKVVMGGVILRPNI